MKVPSLDEIERNFEQWQSAPADKRAKVLARNATLKTRKEAKFTTRLNQDDFEGLKKLAVEKGMPYQTLLGHIIHLYVGQKLVDVGELKKILKLKKIG